MAVNSALGLDIGEKRIGVARVGMIARIPEPLTTLVNDETFSGALGALIDEYQPDILVVGLPRNLEGLETAQTQYVKVFTQQNLQQYHIPVVFQDETLSSRTAEARLTGGPYPKEAIDAEAAAIILEDYVQAL